MSTNNVKKTKTSEIIRIDPFKIKIETNQKKTHTKRRRIRANGGFTFAQLQRYFDVCTLILNDLLAIKMIMVNKIEIVTTQDKFLFVNAKICIIEGTCISYKINSIESSRVSGLYFDKSQKDIYFKFSLPSYKKKQPQIYFF